MQRPHACTIAFLINLTATLLAGSSFAETRSGAGTLCGSSEASTCYLQTKLDTLHTGSALRVCTDALTDPSLSSSDRAHTLVNRATNLNNLKRFEAARTDVEKALHLQPNLAEAFVTRGNSFLLEGAARKALGDYDRALQLDLRERHAGHLNRGLTYQALKKHEDAYADFRAASEILPDWSLPREFIALYQKQFGFE